MKFTSYQNQGQVGAPNLGVTGLKSSVIDRDMSATMNAAGNTARIAMKGFNTIADTVNNAKAMDANNFYNKRMAEECAYLMDNFKEGDAVDITHMYDGVQKKVMDETNKAYGNYIGYGKAAETFKAFTDKDNITRRNGMLQYQMAETEKYENNVFTNQVTDCRNLASSNGYTGQDMDNGLNRLEAVVYHRFNKYGDERVKLELQKQRTDLVKDAIGNCFANDKYDRAEVMMMQYAKDVTPEMKTAYDKMFDIHRKAEYAKTIGNKLWKDKGSVAGVQAALEGAKEPNAEALNNLNNAIWESGAVYDLGGDGQSAWDCALYTQHGAAALGKTLNSREADMQYYQLEQEGNITTDAASAGPYALIFWSGTTDRWGYSDDPFDPDPGKSYKGITHVGIMMPDGKAMQFGSEGLQEMDPDRYDIVGYGRIAVGYTQEEKDEILKRAKANYADEQAQRRENIDNMTQSYTAQAIAMKNSGMTGLDIYDSLSDGVTDVDTLKAIKGACSAANLSVAQGGGAGGRAPKLATLTAEGKSDIIDWLRSGQIPNSAALENLMSGDENHPGFTDADKNKARKLYDDYVNGRGVFAIGDESAILDLALEPFGYKGQTRAAIRNGMKLRLRMFVQKYGADNKGAIPSDEDIVEYLQTEEKNPRTYNVPYYGGWGIFENRLQVTTTELGALGLIDVKPVMRDGQAQPGECIVVYRDGTEEWMEVPKLLKLLGREK